MTMKNYYFTQKGGCVTKAVTYLLNKEEVTFLCDGTYDQPSRSEKGIWVPTLPKTIEEVRAALAAAI